MNIFRLAGDMMHLLSIVVLLLKILATKSCRAHNAAATAVAAAAACPGISLKTQELYLLVFVTRYLDLFTHFVSM
ncbi:hypothetical protein MNEG_14280 [Monoraphidium neglectum]|uniref:ER lumen protein retaining receptor n=1 Tax=Monoraphidium neglectum TaxID=145388 RepID=A0A0D2LVV6_9CHLO|nr:hypothetical protein MNEG_14280 [Monoraphidium neglectum]KIY93681.1 hypothetical protein MNEG_14280 [Monoraphidium neglectum]|eukprot:XP_013892701.1 hypothetical protein MNEG_14280 [Monoraphidium neglectum]